MFIKYQISGDVKEKEKLYSHNMYGEPSTSKYAKKTRFKPLAAFAPGSNVLRGDLTALIFALPLWGSHDVCECLSDAAEVNQRCLSIPRVC